MILERISRAKQQAPIVVPVTQTAAIQLIDDSVEEALKTDVLTVAQEPDDIDIFESIDTVFRRTLDPKDTDWWMF